MKAPRARQRRSPSSVGARVRAFVGAIGLVAGCTHRSAAPPASSPSQRSTADAAESWACGAAGVSVQVLGSGGPIAGPRGRRSTSYLVWVDGMAKLMVDMGQGASHGFGRSGAKVDDLQAILLTHLHADHAADLVPFAKSASFGSRTQPLPVVGPSAGGDFPAVDELLELLFGAKGAFRYLKALEADARFSFAARAVDGAASGTPVEAFSGEGLTVRALGVTHGPVPALAYSVTVNDRKVVFMGDQTAESSAFVDLVRGADVLVAHLAIGEKATDAARALHATPARVGEVARAGEVGHLVLAHLMSRALDDIDAHLAAIRQRYAGPTTLARDGLCVSAAGVSP